MIKLDAIDSTNSYLKRLLTKDSLDDLTVVVSKHQTKGKGRNGNIWKNESSLNLAFSIYKKFNKLDVKDKFMLNVISSLSVFQLLKENNLNKLTIKWPNDIMTGKEKISGILIENSIKGKLINHSVIGVGINVNQKKFKDLPNATSLFIETGLKFSLDSLANRLAEIFSKNFFLFDKNEDDLLEYYNSQLFLKNKDSNFKGLDNKNFSGKIIRVNKKGELRIWKSNKEHINYLENTIKFEP
jgi:BirA family biotin operon repressor/biotin-[acetyl-CoA-carboxylase] ligase